MKIFNDLIGWTLFKGVTSNYETIQQLLRLKEKEGDQNEEEDNEKLLDRDKLQNELDKFWKNTSFQLRIDTRYPEVYETLLEEKIEKLRKNGLNRFDIPTDANVSDVLPRN